MDWEHYPPDTWSFECDSFIGLIKQIEDDHFVYVVGDVADAHFNGTVNNLSDAQAIIQRWCWLVKNVTPTEAEALINKL